MKSVGLPKVVERVQDNCKVDLQNSWAATEVEGGEEGRLRRQK
jgi:hypothetical protein